MYCGETCRLPVRFDSHCGGVLRNHANKSRPFLASSQPRIPPIDAGDGRALGALADTELRAPRRPGHCGRFRLCKLVDDTKIAIVIIIP